MSRSSIRFDTDQIRLLREWLIGNSTLADSIGQFVQFRVVIDANFVIQDISRRVRFPERGPTALQQMVKATMLVVFAPRWLETEMASAIPQVATKRNLPEEKLWACWHEYKALLTWDETWSVPPERVGTAIDPKDLPYVLLEKTIQASGVLSNDRDIEKMGGTRLDLDFVFSVQQHARSAVVSVGIRAYGTMVGAVSLKSLIKLLHAIKNLLQKLPPVLQAFLLVAAMIAIAHPVSRNWMSQRLRAAWPFLAQFWTGIGQAIEMADEKAGEADKHLTMVLAEIEKHRAHTNTRL